MNENTLMSYLLMDRSYEFTQNLFFNDPKSILHTAGYRYYTLPYAKQISKYFRELFQLGNEQLILMLMDQFELYIQSDIDELRISIFNYILDCAPYLDVAKIRLISDLQCNITLIKISQEFHKKYISKSSNKLSDLYAYNKNILKYLQKDVKTIIDLNQDLQISTNKNNLINKCLKFKINYGKL